MAKYALTQASKNAIADLWLAGYNADEIFRDYPHVSRDYYEVVSTYICQLNAIWINMLIQMDRGETTGIYGISINPSIKE